MLIDGSVYYIAEYSFETLLPKRGANICPSGLKDSDEGHVKYGPPSSDQPTLKIIAPIYDEDRNAIKPGFYELSINDDSTFLLLNQNGQNIAKIPVFKVEQDKIQMEKYAKENKTPQNLYEDVKYKVKNKLAKRKKQKLLNNHKIEENPEVYNEATIEYDIKGDYYLIKYERGSLRAWGVLKSN